MARTHSLARARSAAVYRRDSAEIGDSWGKRLPDDSQEFLAAYIVQNAQNMTGMGVRSGHLYDE